MRVDFVRLANLGYPRLLPVIPPDAPLAPDASRELIASRGKVPGRRVLYQSGAPAPFFAPLKRWLDYHLTEQDARWHTESGCNAGLILGPASACYCLDLDISNEQVANVAHQALAHYFNGQLQPYRVGNYPKVAYYFRAPPGPGIRRVRYKLTDWDGVEHLIELLGEGQQSVIAGTHPKTHAAFQWAIPGAATYSELPPPFGLLTQLDITALTGLPEYLANALSAHAGCRLIASEGRVTGGVTKPQTELLAPSIEALIAAVDALPNTHALFPTRNDYIQVGYAIRAAAGPEREHEAFDLWDSWCARWDHGTNEFETVAKDWRGMVGDKRVGWNWLLKRARECGVELGGLDFINAPLPDDRPGHPDLGPPPEDGVVAYSQDDCAQRITLEQQWRFCYRALNPRTVEWLRWNGSVWEVDQNQSNLRHVIRLTARTMAKQWLEAEPSATTMRSVRAFGSLPFLNGVLGNLVSFLELNAASVRFDPNPWLLNTPAGIINLTNGKLLAHDAKQLCMSITRVSPKLNPTPEQLSFTRSWMNQITCGDAEVELFLYRLMALALTGYTGIQRWFVMLGRGGNGKSTLLNLMLHILGDYATGTNAETFQVNPRGAKDYGLTRFRGKRLVVATEAAGQAVWNTSLLAAITGGDVIEAEEKYKQPETFTSMAKVLIASNLMPRLRTVDDALTRRFTAIAFNARFPALDPEVPRRLEAEAPAFLGLLIQHAAALYTGVAHGLGADKLLPLPQAVRDASLAELRRQDLIGQWIEEYMVPDANAVMAMSAAYDHFARTMLDKHNRDMPKHVFSQELAKRGYDRTRKGHDRARSLVGLRFRPEQDAQAAFDAADAAAARSNIIHIHTRQALALGAEIEEQTSEEPRS